MSTIEVIILIFGLTISILPFVILYLSSLIGMSEWLRDFRECLTNQKRREKEKDGDRS